MRKKFLIVLITTLSLGSLLTPVTHAANIFDQAETGLEQGAQTTFNEDELDSSQTVFTDRAIFIVNFVLGFISIIFFILLIYAGWLWMTSQGNEEKITKSQKISREVIIGLLIILFARIITAVLIRQVDEVATTPNYDETSSLDTSDSGLAE